MEMENKLDKHIDCLVKSFVEELGKVKAVDGYFIYVHNTKDEYYTEADGIICDDDIKEQLDELEDVEG